MILTDTHCHLDSPRFNVDRSKVLQRAHEIGIHHILVPGINLISSRAALRLAEEHPMLMAAVGIHPTEAGTWNYSSAQELRKLTCLNPNPFLDERGTICKAKIVAIGEIGLDYYWNSTSHDVQKSTLKKQLSIAAELSLPVILHMREKSDSEHGPCAVDLIQILKEWVHKLRRENNPIAERPGVLHSFSGTMETAQIAMKLGFFIGVSGPITFKNAHKRQALIAQLPLQKILIETDAPFLSPHPHRGRRNEPAYINLIADKIAALHSLNLEDVARITTKNARWLFAWKNQL